MDRETFVRQERARLLLVASSLVADPHLAQDLVHDVLLKALQRWDLVSAADHPHAYLRRMLANEVVSWRRKWSRVTVRPDHDLDRSVPDMTSAVEHRDAVRRAIGALPPGQRAAVVLRYLEDMSDADIADELGCSAVTVRVRVHRALTTLRAAGADQQVPA